MNPDDWRRRLAEALAEGIGAEGAEVVRVALLDEVERLSGTPEQARPVVDAPVLGVQACREGWVGVLLVPDRPAAVLAAATIAGLVELARVTAEPAVVAIEIPVGRTLEVDDWLRSRPAVEVIEVQSELSFAQMRGSPVLARKNDPDGVRARRAALEAVGMVPPAWYRGSDFGEADLLDACAAAWSALGHISRPEKMAP